MDTNRTSIIQMKNSCCLALLPPSDLRPLSLYLHCSVKTFIHLFAVTSCLCFDQEGLSLVLLRFLMLPHSLLSEAGCMNLSALSKTIEPGGRQTFGSADEEHTVIPVQEKDHTVVSITTWWQGRPLLVVFGGSVWVCVFLAIKSFRGPEKKYSTGNRSSKTFRTSRSAGVGLSGKGHYVKDTKMMIN